MKRKWENPEWAAKTATAIRKGLAEYHAANSPLTAMQREQAILALNSGQSTRQVAEQFGVSHETIRKIGKKAVIEDERGPGRAQTGSSEAAQTSENRGHMASESNVPLTTVNPNLSAEARERIERLNAKCRYHVIEPILYWLSGAEFWITIRTPPKFSQPRRVKKL
jgi:hypothetical protein